MSGRGRVFGHGDLRLYLLSVLDENPRHGYELIRVLEDRFLGMYTPSAGTIYPRLSALEDDGLVEVDEHEGRKVYRLTDAGRDELQNRRDEVQELEARVARSARDLAREIRDDVKSSVRDLRRELRDAAKEVSREERRISHETRRTAADAQRVASHEARRLVRGLQHDLQAFVADVSAAARRHRLDSDRVSDLRDALLDARSIILDALEGRRPVRDHEPPSPPEPPAPPAPPEPPASPAPQPPPPPTTPPDFQRGDLPPHC